MRLSYHPWEMGGPNYMNTVALEVEPTLQTYNGNKKDWIWEKYVSCPVKYHITLKSQKEINVFTRKIP